VDYYVTVDIEDVLINDTATVVTEIEKEISFLGVTPAGTTNGITADMSFEGVEGLDENKEEWAKHLVRAIWSALGYYVPIHIRFFDIDPESDCYDFEDNGDFEAMKIEEQKKSLSKKKLKEGDFNVIQGVFGTFGKVKEG
jgi:hypothetical protein